MGYASVVLADAPLAYYRLGESSGTTAKDSAAGNDGTLSGTITLSQPGALRGDVNKAMLFDGSSGFIALPGGVNPATFTAFSVEFWINLTGAYTGNPRPIANSHSDQDHNGFQIILQTGGAMTFSLGNGTTQDGANTVSSIAAGSWAYIVGTYDNINAKIYFNGNLQGTVAHAGAITASGFPVNIGRNPAYAGDYIPATLDEVAFYAKTLTADQIKHHYTAGLTPGSGIAARKKSFGRVI